MIANLLRLPILVLMEVVCHNQANAKLVSIIATILRDAWEVRKNAIEFQAKNLSQVLINSVLLVHQPDASKQDNVLQMNSNVFKMFHRLSDFITTILLLVL